MATATATRCTSAIGSERKGSLGGIGSRKSKKEQKWATGKVIIAIQLTILSCER